MDASTSNTPLPGLFQGSEDLFGRQINKIQVLGQIIHHLRRGIGLQAYREVAARQSREDLSRRSRVRNPMSPAATIRADESQYAFTGRPDPSESPP